MRIPKTVRQNEVYMSYGLRRERQGSGTSKGSKAIHREMKRANVCGGHLETVGYRQDFDPKGLARYLPVSHTYFTLHYGYLW